LEIKVKAALLNSPLFIKGNKKNVMNEKDISEKL
jgi:hypothetical protein